MMTTKASTALTGSDLLNWATATVAQIYALLGQVVTCSDGPFMIVGVTSSGLLTLLAQAAA